MRALSAEEVRRRIDAVSGGPWAKSIARAHRDLAAPEPIEAVSEGIGPLQLDTLRLSSANKRKDTRLAVILRSHLDDDHGITDRGEMEVRDALDATLTVPQLYELAVQTGYLPLEAVQQPSRSLFRNLFWSSSARRFVNDYDYVALPMLAARVGVSGLGPARPPSPDDKAALRFAGFLAHLRAFCQDDKIDTWTRFLDDYVVERDEQNKLWSYLRGSAKAPARAPVLLTGCMRFVTSLASAFGILDDEELGRFGMIHAYWLQKFFGYKRVRGRYVKNVAVWGRDDSWARSVSASPHLTDDVDEVLGGVLRGHFSEDIVLLNRTFDAVRYLCEGSRRSRASARKKSPRTAGRAGPRRRGK